MKKFCESFREHTMKIIRLKKKNNEVINKRAARIIRQWKNLYLKDKKYCKNRDHCHHSREQRGAAHSICNLKYITTKKIPITFHSDYNYDYHFIIKEFAEEF